MRPRNPGWGARGVRARAGFSSYLHMPTVPASVELCWVFIVDGLWETSNHWDQGVSSVTDRSVADRDANLEKSDNEELTLLVILCSVIGHFFHGL
jgi:hypothetical protein